MRTTQQAVWTIEATMPPIKDDPNRRWARNITFTAICLTAERALEMIREVHGEATVHVVRRISASRPMYWDDAGETTFVDQDPSGP
jgi:hypothetical protein